jgi:hypothetical protein
MIKYNLNSNRSLPPGEGPKLKPFKYRNHPIHFLDILSDYNEDSASPGGHAGHVFKVRIKETVYALKVVSCLLITIRRKC